MQDLNDMLFFAEVAERGSFAAAGRALGLPKSRLSRRVAELEGRLGVRLLQRTTRRLSLTDVGAQYLRHCVAVREEAEAASDVVALVHSEPRGTLRVSCPVTLAQTTIGELLPRFLLRHPLVTIDMREQLRRHGPVATVNELNGLDTVAMSATDGRGVWRLLGPGGGPYEWTHQPRFVADDLLTLKFAVLDGAGVSLLPDYMCRDELQDGRLVEVLPGWCPPPGRVHAVFASRRGLAPSVRRFLDFLGERMGTAEGDPWKQAGRQAGS